jgi:hypothetical protein
LNAADYSLVVIGYDLLLVREYQLVETLLRFATQPPFKHASAEIEMMLKMNLAIALKAQAKSDECTRLLDAIDFSAMSDLFRLCEAALRGNYEQAAAWMQRIGRTGRPSKEDYLEWPLFRWLRKSDEFVEAFSEVFGEPPRTAHNAEVEKDLSSSGKSNGNPEDKSATDQGALDTPSSNGSPTPVR